MSAVRTRFRTAWRKLVPGWLARGEGELLLYSLGLMLDSFAERGRISVLARHPDHAPADALASLGRDRQIVRGRGEVQAAFAARLVRWLDDHRLRGNPYALMQQVRAFCNSPVRLRTVDTRGNWYTLERDGTKSVELAAGNWDWRGDPATKWSQFWLIIYPTTDATPLPWAQAPTWGEAGAVYSRERTWGTTATPAEVDTVRRIVREWKPAGTRCVRIIVAFDDASFDPTAAAGSPGLPAGTWGRWSNGEDPARTDRLSTARYWKGTGGPLT